MLNQRTIAFFIGLFLAVVAGMFAFAYFSRPTDVPLGTNEDQMSDADGPYSDITRIDAKHFYIDGTHTVAGEILMPTPCDLLEANATVAESSPEQVTIDFTVINNAETCTQVVTPQRFLVSFDASPDATIQARFMGRDVELNLVPAAEGETPEDFELYIKG